MLQWPLYILYPWMVNAASMSSLVLQEHSHVVSGNYWHDPAGRRASFRYNFLCLWIFTTSVPVKHHRQSFSCHLLASSSLVHNAITHHYLDTKHRERVETFDVQPIGTPAYASQISSLGYNTSDRWDSVWASDSNLHWLPTRCVCILSKQGDFELMRSPEANLRFRASFCLSSPRLRMNTHNGNRRQLLFSRDVARETHPSSSWLLVIC